MKKNTLTKSDILHLVKLSQLELTDKEIEKYGKQLEETVEYINNLNELKTEEIKPTSHTTNLTNIFFNDGEKSDRQLTQEEALANAKNKKDGFFVVKRII